MINNEAKDTEEIQLKLMTNFKNLYSTALTIIK